MPKILKKTTVTLTGKTYKDLPFLGFKFESVDEVLKHPAIAGRLEPEFTTNEAGEKTQTGLSVLDLVNYAWDLKERPKVKSAWTDRIVGPMKSLIGTAKDLVKAASSVGQVLTLEQAIDRVKTMLGISEVKTDTDLTSPVDSEPLMFSDEPEENGEETEEKTV